VSVIAILVFSTVFAAIPTIPRASAQQQVPGKNWENVNYDIFSTNFSPQTQINKDNIQFTELQWIFAFPPAPAAGIGGYAGFREGPGTPFVIDGVVIVPTNFGAIYALDAGNGKQVWVYNTQLDFKADVAKGYKIRASLPGHLHGISYFEGKLWLPTASCDIHVVDINTGKLLRKVENLCANVPGNVGWYKGAQSYGPVFYKKDRVAVIPAGVVSEGVDSGRGFIAGVNIDTGELLWRFFVLPEQCKSDPEWTLRVADKGWIQGIRASTLPREVLLNDWHYQGFVTCKDGQSAAGAGAAWGQWAVDEDTGIVYAATAQPSPDWNATYRPGPNVFSDSVVALKATTGELVWWHQTTAHDLWDWDCAWNTVMGKATIGGSEKKVVYKGCKNGRMHAFDAATGELIWKFDAPTIKRAPHSQLLDPRDPAAMKKGWLNAPDTGPTWQNPPSAGSIESDVSLAYGNIYVATYNFWNYLKAAPVEPTQLSSAGRTAVPAPETRASNTTIYALDAATGQPKWSFFSDGSGYRGGLVATGGLIYASLVNGNLYALDAQTGKLVSQKRFGVPLPQPPIFGADAKGKMMMFQAFGGGIGSVVGANVPGAIMAFGLPDKPIEPVIKEVVKEVQVPKEVIKEVTKEVTKTVTVETVSPVSYAIIGVGVVLVVIAGVMMSRRKKA
ncbi:MAG: PQQ-binding-like beta-propeller repeat protein, partial [Thaumarchaeota archaeon]|nr:PQQ-binding-like beta-propeller repeat protein [Nitrososphaerota archaeon]